jgi:hypothetical protein
MVSGRWKKVSKPAEAYYVPHPTTIYKILRRDRQRDFLIYKGANKRFCCLRYGIIRLSKSEETIEPPSGRS